MPFAVVVALFERVYLAIQYPPAPAPLVPQPLPPWQPPRGWGPGRAHEGSPTPPPPSPEPPLIDLDEANVGLPPALRVLAHQTWNLWDDISNPYGTRPAFRVGQVDAELLDEELLELLKNQAGEGLKLFGAHLKDDWSAEIGLALRAILWKLSIWDHGASYGASLQGLQYVDARESNAAARTPPKAWQKIAYGLLTVGGRYGWSRWEDYLSSTENSYDAPSTLIQKLSRFTTLAGTTHEIAAF
ncbi:hypothetical protein KC352_g16039, partial [Hortaea werneckii]